MTPQTAMNDGMIVAVVGNTGTLAHENKYKFNFEYSFSKLMFVKRDAIK
jgi:hypothetical protein